MSRDEQSWNGSGRTGRTARASQPSRAARERKRKKQMRARVALAITALVLLIAIIVVIVVACSNKKREDAEAATAQTSTEKTGLDRSAIPKEEVEATFIHDEIAQTDENPVQGTDTDCTIRVNTALNVTVFYNGNGVPEKAFACSTGRRDGHETPEGTFTMGEWIVPPMSEWCYMADGTQGLYAYRIIDNINNDIMFHSVPYYETDHGTLEIEEYNKLGEYASMGCIRMACQDVRWLGERCGTGTTVVIYYDENEQLPLAKPEPYRIPLEIEQVRGWDPTDPVTYNPWHTYSIDLRVPNSVDVKKDTDYTVDPVQAAVSVHDNFGNDLSGYVTVEGSYDNSKRGIYKVRVRCDVGPAHAYKDVYVVVE